MDFGMVLHYLAGPAVGGLIGYFTNFIAIRMLFRPRHEIRIGNHVLPFTPGIIPKRKNLLARAIGETVAAKVFTEGDIEKVFLSEGMKNAVADSLMAGLYEEGGFESLVGLLGGVMDEEEFGRFQEDLDSLISHKVHLTINRANIAEKVSEECSKILREKSQGSLSSKVMNPSRISAVSDYMGTRLQQYTKEHADTLIMPLIREETAKVLVQPAGELLSEMNLDREQVRELIGRAYMRFIRDHSMEVVKIFDIASLTEQKIIEFQVEEVEELVNQTIHREMQAVVNLGAVLGVIIGIVNVFL